MSAERVMLDPDVAKRLSDKAARLESLSRAFRDGGSHREAKERAQSAADIRAALSAAGDRS